MLEYTGKELTDALNERLAGTMKVLDMTPVVDAEKASTTSLVSAAMEKGVGILLLACGDMSTRLVHRFTAHDAVVSCGAVLFRFDDARLGTLPISKQSTLSVTVRKICNTISPQQVSCPICLEAIGMKGTKRATHLPCGHALHHACLRTLVGSSRSMIVNSWGVLAIRFNCPECRTGYAMDADHESKEKPTIWGTQPTF